MARVVQRKSLTTLYILIVFVFLFIISGVMAGLFYMRWDESQKTITELKSEQEELIASAEVQDPRLQRAKELAEQNDRTVVGQLIRENEQLKELITLREDMPLAQISRQHKELYDRLKIENSAGLIQDLRSAYETIDLRQNRVEQLDEKITQLNNDITRLRQEKEDQQVKFAADLKEIEDRVEAQAEEYAQAREVTDKSFAADRDEWKRIRGELDSTIAQQTANIESLNTEIAKKEASVAYFKRLVTELKGEGRGDRTDPLQPVTQADGKILRVFDADGLVYINLGSDERIVPDLTFSVYPPTGIPNPNKSSEEAAGKGKIIVTRVNDNTATARIIQQDPKNPISSGDLIGNVVYHKIKTFEFAVIGRFDLYGTGSPRQSAQSEVKTIIRRFGGEVAEDMDYHTDFLILGEAPAKPEQPGEDQPAQVWTAYRDQMKTFQQYQDMVSAAKTYNIGILKTEQFLALTGYKPVQTLETTAR
ncbi:MAG: hypothetical protein ACLFVU_14795 [Phycisphaerae bacterium]